MTKKNKFKANPKHVEAVREALAKYPEATYRTIGELVGISEPHTGNIARHVLGAAPRPNRGQSLALAKRKREREQAEAAKKLMARAPAREATAPKPSVTREAEEARLAGLRATMDIGHLRNVYAHKVDLTDMLSELTAKRIAELERRVETDGVRLTFGLGADGTDGIMARAAE